MKKKLPFFALIVFFITILSACGSEKETVQLRD